MLTPLKIDTTTQTQIPLFPASSRVSNILMPFSDEFERIYRVLNDWVDKYGQLSIQLDRTAIIAGEYRIALEDITPKNASQNGIETFSNISFSPGGDILTTEPGSIDMVPPDGWMVLIDNIPGIGAEKRDNLLELLGNECFSHQDDVYKMVYGEGYDIYFVYHTGESLGEDDGQYYWQLFIRSLPISLNERHGSSFMDEYAIKYPKDQELRDWGDEYIHFDVFPVNGNILDIFSAPPAAMRAYG